MNFTALSKLTLLALLLAACGGNCSDGSAGADLAVSNSNSDTTPGEPVRLSDLGEGFVVWESSRSGAWRLWRRALDQGQPTQLVADEAGRNHCCAHISPDGSWIAYLSIGGRGDEYQRGTATGELRLIAADGSTQRVVGPARVHHENRSAVWRNDRALVYIDGGGRTLEWSLEDGSTRQVLRQTEETYGWLPDPTLSYATKGEPTFSRLVDRSIRRAHSLSGCQPYFTHDGRWGFWTGGAGGPIYRLALKDGTSGVEASRTPETILAKDDPRLPVDHRYLYFPMVSRDGRFLTWGASKGQHNHHQADYEVFVAEVDPQNLELVGDPIRVTDHPSTDRYADIFVKPPALGVHRGEAPLTVQLRAATGGTWDWDLGDGSSATGTEIEHTYRRPGSYVVTASRGTSTSLGRVLARPAAPPELLGWSLLDDRALALDFDEPVNADQAEVSGVAGDIVTVPGDRRSLRIALTHAIQEPVRVELRGIQDLAQVPNRAGTIGLDIDPALWPVEHPSTLLTWTGVDGWNTLRVEGSEAEAVEFERRGTAVPAAGGAVRTHGGWLELDRETSIRLGRALQQTHEFTLELVFRRGDDASGDLLTWGLPSPRNTNLALALANSEFTTFVRAKSPHAKTFDPPVSMSPISRGWHHLAFVFRPGELTVYLDGKQMPRTTEFDGDLFHWRDRVLRVGGWEDPALQLAIDFQGMALHRRALSPTQVKDAAGRALRAFDRPDPEQWAVRGERVATTPTPSLKEISPYTEALVTRRYRLRNPPEGLPAEVTVAEWGILDGKVLAQPAANRALVLQRFADQAALEGLFLANDFGAETLYYTPPG